MISFLREKLESMSDRPLIMGVLNVTPDSFSDGGRFLDLDDAVRHGESMIADGAGIIDVGPESTRPGALPVDADEQIRRAIPVIEKLRRAHPDVELSIDTRLCPVARAALDAGAGVVNDVSAGRDDPGMLDLVARRGAGLILMHMQGTPATMQCEPVYRDLLEDVLAFLRDRVKAAESAGVDARRIIIDPGIGFGKTVSHNLTLLKNLERLVATGRHVLLGCSRKSFLKHVGGGDDPSDRLAGSLACVARAMAACVAIVRVHDVRETKRFIDALHACSHE